MRRRDHGTVRTLRDPARDGAEEPVPQRGPTRGTLEALLPDGRFSVRVTGTVMPAAIATVCSEEDLLAAISARRDVLIIFMEGEPALPVIVGVLRDRIEALPTDAAPSEPRFVQVEASDAIRLRPGDSSLELRADGRVEIRGIEVVSVAEGTNRILGGHVAIN